MSSDKSSSGLLQHSQTCLFQCRTARTKLSAGRLSCMTGLPVQLEAGICRCSCWELKRTCKVQRSVLLLVSSLQ